MVTGFTDPNACSVQDKLSHSPPPRIPPRQHFQRQSINLAQMNSKEMTSIEVTQNPSSPLENKMSINIATRSGGQGSGKTADMHSIEGTKLHITSNSPFIAKSVSTVSNSPLSTNGGYFMRGSFKSNSVNYGNLMRRSASGEAPVTGHSHFHPISSRHPHYSPQAAFLAARAAPVGQRQASYLAATASPSHNSDSSQSSSQESESDLLAYGSTANNNNNHVTTSRSRITITNNCTTISTNETTTTANGSATDTDNINIQISNVLNNNADPPTTNSCTTDNSTTGTNAAAASNSIWYEYGCV